MEKNASKDIEVTWDSKLGDDLMLDSLDMVELVMFLEECFGVEIPDEMAGEIVTVGDAIEKIKESPRRIKVKRERSMFLSIRRRKLLQVHL